MIQPIRHLLVFGAALLSIFSFAGAQESQIKSPQVKRTGPVSGAQLFASIAPCATGPAVTVMVRWQVQLRRPPPTQPHWLSVTAGNFRMIMCRTC